MLTSAMPVRPPSPPSPADSVTSARTAVLHSAARQAADYLDNVNARSVAPSPEAVAALNELCGPLPEESACPEIVLNLLTRFGSPATVANSGGRDLGFVDRGGGLPARRRARGVCV